MKANYVRKVGCHGNNAGQLLYPADVTYLNDDNILVVDQWNHRIHQFNIQTGNPVESFGKKMVNFRILSVFAWMMKVVLS